MLVGKKRKLDNQVMNSWIANVKNTAYHLDAAGVTIIDEDIILTLTSGLLELYVRMMSSSIIVTPAASRWYAVLLILAIHEFTIRLVVAFLATIVASNFGKLSLDFLVLGILYRIDRS